MLIPARRAISLIFAASYPFSAKAEIAALKTLSRFSGEMFQMFDYKKVKT